jgi:ornithine--oxo-acid transaminase
MYPVSAVLADQDILGLIEPLNTAPLSAAAPSRPRLALPRWKLSKKKSFWNAPFTLGKYFMDHLSEINSRYIKEIRGKGLLIAWN